MKKKTPGLSPELKKKRREIDRVDQSLLNFLNQRIRLVSEAITIKKTTGEKIRIPKREQQILERLKLKNEGPLKEEELKKIFRAILGMCRRHLIFHPP
jgi:chorismate mutase/prephenate dehydratase